jgi:hypothetical protein
MVWSSPSSILQFTRQFFGEGNVRSLRTLVSAAEKQHDFLAALDEVNPIAGAVMNSQFADALADRGCVSRVAKRQPIDPLAGFSRGLRYPVNFLASA